MTSPPPEFRELGTAVVIDIALRVLPESLKPLSPVQLAAIRGTVEDGYAIVEGATRYALVPGIPTLVRHGVLELYQDSRPTIAVAGARLLEECRVELRRRPAPAVVVERSLVIEYLAALDARRELATGRSPRVGKVLRGQARANAVRGAQHRLEAAEAALRKAVR